MTSHQSHLLLAPTSHLPMYNSRAHFSGHHTVKCLAIRSQPLRLNWPTCLRSIYVEVSVPRHLSTFSYASLEKVNIWGIKLKFPFDLPNQNACWYFGFI